MSASAKVLVIKNNENFNLPDVYKMIDVKKQYLNKFKDIILNLNKSDQKYIYHSHYISIAEHALKTKQYSIAKDYYKDAKKYGSLSMKNRFRKIIFTFLNFIK